MIDGTEQRQRSRQRDDHGATAAATTMPAEGHTHCVPAVVWLKLTFSARRLFPWATASAASKVMRALCC